MAESALAAHELSLAYRDGHRRRLAVDCVSAEFEAGKMVMIMGPSGSGKTSLLSLLGLLRSADHGEVRLGGVSLAGLSGNAASAWRRRRVGFVFQQFRLLDRLTAIDNVALPLAFQGVGTAERARRAGEALARVGLGDRALARPRSLSGGEQQRVSLARAVVHDPLIVLADEPTAALDRERGQQVGEWFRQIASDGRIVVATGHDERLAAFADRVVEMEDGRIRCVG